ncbi:RNA polymerase sigma factor [Planctomycetales bacterium 10988]|nr:RNA polymerase sigma factor [Planctomycetales bacterium 10988]
MSSLNAQELFEILVRDHAEMLTLYLRSLIRDPGTVDDLFQETMLVAWRRLDDFDRNRSFGPWLRGIAGKLVLAHRRKYATSKAITCEEEVLQHLEGRMQQVQKQAGDTLPEKLAGLEYCLQALPEKYGKVVKLRYREELSIGSLAERLELTVETAKKRLQRGRARLLDCLKRRMATSVS